jgi:hypothetical protein
VNPPGIGSLTEKSLHRRLKEIYGSGASAVLEAPVGSYIVDVKKPKEIVEIQTRNLYSIKKKLTWLLENHRVRLVYPLIFKKTLIFRDESGREVRRGLSSKRQGFAHASRELGALSDLIGNPGLIIELLLTELEEDRFPLPPPEKNRGAGRRRYRPGDCRLVRVAAKGLFRRPQDYRVFLPPGLGETWTVKELSRIAPGGRRTAGETVGFLKKIGQIEVDRREGRAFRYRLQPPLTFPLPKGIVKYPKEQGEKHELH